MHQPLNDPREIRKILMVAAHRGGRIDGKDCRDSISPASSLLRNVMFAAEHLGYSGEDTMTVLAYNALLHYERLMDNLLEQASLNPVPLVQVIPAGDK